MIPVLRAKAKYLVLTCLTLLVIVGCGDSHRSDPVAADSPGPIVVENPVFIKRLPSRDTGQLPRLVATNTVIGVDGGTLQNAFVTLVFPAGALDGDTQISVEIVDPELMLVEFRPEGIVFNTPVIMTFDLMNTTAEGTAAACGVGWYNPSAMQWELLESYSTGPNSLNATLYHFSKYGGLIGG
ncbi:MAG: hypothetical protein OEO21_06950 [Candidatus Krumholzibacteria bacterium]|nr:hypothetical protein [Candidatus Krumholzibacteria bacterium]